MRGLKFFISTILVASTILFSAVVEAAELTILHTNDFHARVLNTDDGGKSMGLAEMVAAIKVLKAQNKNSLLLDAGDTFHGMPAINISKGENMLTFLNLSELDAMTPGNHDFNYGVDVLLKLSKQAKFDVLDANLVYRSNDKLVFKPYKIYTLPDNVKVGVFGLTTPETQYKARPSYVSGVNFLNPVEIAKDMVKQLRPKCDVLIAITHLGVEETAEFTSIRLADEVDGIDLIVDGHSHTVLPTGLTIGDTLIVQTGCHAYNLGKVTIQLDGKKITSKTAELLDANAVKKIAPVPDKNIARAITQMEIKNKKLFSQVVAQSSKQLPNSRSLIRSQETELGDFIADAFRWYTSAEIAVINSGAVRDGLPAGNVTYGDIVSIFPFGDQLKVVEISGVKIREMLEHSPHNYGDFGGFLQVSGIRFNYEPEKPEGERISEIFVGDAPLVDDKIYRLGTRDFLLEGGDGYDMLKKLSVINNFGTCEEAVIEYLKENGSPEIITGRMIRKVG